MLQENIGVQEKSSLREEAFNRIAFSKNKTKQNKTH